MNSSLECFSHATQCCPSHIFLSSHHNKHSNWSMHILWCSHWSTKTSSQQFLPCLNPATSHYISLFECTRAYPCCCILPEKPCTLTTDWWGRNLQSKAHSVHDFYWRHNIYVDCILWKTLLSEIEISPDFSCLILRHDKCVQLWSIRYKTWLLKTKEDQDPSLTLIDLVLSKIPETKPTAATTITIIWKTFHNNVNIFSQQVSR